MPKFAQLKNDTFLRALLRQPTEYTPVWLMRQAGRYLPEYRKIRKHAGSFMGLATNPNYATEVTLQPLARFPLDAAILFSDILMVPDAMGLGLHFVDGEGPRFDNPLREEKDILALQKPDLSKLNYVFESIKQTRTELGGSVPLIGFAGSPWTLACYMIEGKSSRDFHTTKTMLYKRPDLVHFILNANTKAVKDYLNAQIDAGAQAIMVFDSWGGILADGAYQSFSLDYMRQVLSQLQREKEGIPIPVIVFTKGGGLWLEEIANIGTDAIGLDWTVNLKSARDRVGQHVALQGNLDPAVLLSSPKQVSYEVSRLLSLYGAPKTGENYIFNLGHGVSQFTPPESVAAMVDSVHAVSRKLRI
jgi:uroporphyrinogen decarboxylase